MPITQYFKATVTGTASTTDVTWTLENPSHLVDPGTINSLTGLYTPGVSNGPVTIKAISVADPLKYGIATVTVRNPDMAQFSNIKNGMCYSNGYLYLCDEHRIRKIDLSTGLVMSLFGTFPNGQAVAAGTDDRLYAISEHIIYQVAQNGDSIPFAGSYLFGYLDGLGSQARFNYPSNIWIDPTTGIGYVSDAQNYRIRSFQTDGTVTTFAGNGDASTIDGPADSASFGDLSYGNITKGLDGTFYVIDGQKVRSIKLVLGTYQVSTLINLTIQTIPTGIVVLGTLLYILDIEGHIFVYDLNSHVINNFVGLASVTPCMGLILVNGILYHSACFQIMRVDLDGTRTLLVGDPNPGVLDS